VHVASVKSFTADEPHYVARGLRLWQEGDYHFARVLLHHPPLAYHLAAAPAEWLGIEPAERDEAFLERPEDELARRRLAVRLPFVALACWGALLCFLWACEAAGPAAGVLAAFLYTFSPNVLAYGPLAHSDIAVTVFVLQTLHAYWRWTRRPTAARLVVCGVSFGLALASKHSAILLFGVFGLLLASAWLRWPRGGPVLGPEGPGRRLAWLAGAGAGILLPALAVLWLAYGGSFAWVRDPNGAFPDTPLPGYLRAFFADLDYNERGRRVFFLGEFAEYGWWYFYPVAFLLKTPPATLLLLAGAVATLAREPARVGRAIGVTLFVFVVIVCFWVDIPAGLRYVLPLFPLLFVFTAAQLAPLARGARGLLVLAASAWLAVSSAVAHPHYLAYFSELAGGSRQGHRYLLDANLDWGQDLATLAHWLRERGNPPVWLAYFGAERPASYGMRARPLPGCRRVRGLVAISANVLQELYRPSGFGAPPEGCYAWLREREPLARPAPSIFVYDTRRK